MSTTKVEILHGHLFCGLGGGAEGFNQGSARVGNLEAEFRCLGGIDNDPAAIRDFTRAAGVQGTVMDLFDRDQYVSFHGRQPPAGWKEATPADIHRAFGYERPHILFTSAPCKGFSGLLAENKSRTDKYQALNRLTLRGMFLALEAYADDPVELIIFENVPRIATRGRPLLDQIQAMLRHYGYAVAETTHDCGELGGLAQRRKRFLMVARHVAKVPPFLYEPPKRKLRSVGEVLGRLPLPGDPAAGPMHRVPSLQWKTWVRLAFVEAGSDWRSLNKLRVEDGRLADYLIVPEYHHGYMGVSHWNEPSGTISSRSGPTNGSYSVADPRFFGQEYSQYGVMGWKETGGAVSGQSAPGGGRYSVADPRFERTCHNNVYRVIRMDEVSPTITSGNGPSSGGIAVADPRAPHGSHRRYPVTDWDNHTSAIIAGSASGQGAYAVADPRPSIGAFAGKYEVTPWEETAACVIAGSTTGQGAFAVADPRLNLNRGKGDHYLTGGHYGVVPWGAHSYAVSGAACHDNGHWSVADPRVDEAAIIPAQDQKLVAIIRALDGTWHRPMTTLDMAALQSLYDPDDYIEGGHYDLDGESDSAKRERIGNAVPRYAARAIAGMMGETLLLSWSGQTFALSSTPIWVRPVAIALSVAQGESHG